MRMTVVTGTGERPILPGEKAGVTLSHPFLFSFSYASIKCSAEQHLKATQTFSSVLKSHFFLKLCYNILSLLRGTAKIRIK